MGMNTLQCQVGEQVNSYELKHDSKADALPSLVPQSVWTKGGGLSGTGAAPARLHFVDTSPREWSEEAYQTSGSYPEQNWGRRFGKPRTCPSSRCSLAHTFSLLAVSTQEHPIGAYCIPQGASHTTRSKGHSHGARMVLCCYAGMDTGDRVNWPKHPMSSWIM